MAPAGPPSMPDSVLASTAPSPPLPLLASPLPPPSECAAESVPEGPSIASEWLSVVPPLSVAAASSWDSGPAPQPTQSASSAAIATSQPMGSYAAVRSRRIIKPPSRPRCGNARPGMRARTGPRSARGRSGCRLARRSWRARSRSGETRRPARRWSRCPFSECYTACNTTGQGSLAVQLDRLRCHPGHPPAEGARPKRILTRTPVQAALRSARGLAFRVLSQAATWAPLRRVVHDRGRQEHRRTGHLAGEQGLERDHDLGAAHGTEGPADERDACGLDRAGWYGASCQRSACAVRRALHLRRWCAGR